MFIKGFLKQVNLIQLIKLKLSSLNLCRKNKTKQKYMLIIVESEINNCDLDINFKTAA